MSTPEWGKAQHPATTYSSDAEGARLDRGALNPDNEIMLDSTDTPHGAPLIIGESEYPRMTQNANYWAHIVCPGRHRNQGGHTFHTAREALDYVTDECARLLLGEREEGQ